MDYAGAYEIFDYRTNIIIDVVNISNILFIAFCNINHRYFEVEAKLNVTCI